MVEEIQSGDLFHEMRPAWNELLQGSASDCLFLTWEWLHTWWKHLGGGRQLRILAVRQGRELIAIAPLALRPPRLLRLQPFSVLEFLGSGSVGSDYLDLAVRRGSENESLAALADHLRRDGSVLDLAQTLGRRSNVFQLAERLGRFGWRISEQETNQCPYARLGGHTWDSYLGSLGREHRYAFRRKARKLAELHRVEIERVTSEERRPGALAELFRLHESRWVERGGSDALYSGALRAFHEEISRLALERGWLRLFVLHLDGRPAAALYGFVYGGRFYFYQSGFDPAFAGRSVGMVIQGAAIESALSEGAVEYDMLHGCEAYKFHWADQVRPLTRFGLFPASARGELSRSGARLKEAARTMAPRLLPHPQEPGACHRGLPIPEGMA